VCAYAYKCGQGRYQTGDIKWTKWTKSKREFEPIVCSTRVCRLRGLITDKGNFWERQTCCGGPHRWTKSFTHVTENGLMRGSWPVYVIHIQVCRHIICKRDFYNRMSNTPNTNCSSRILAIAVASDLIRVYIRYTRRTREC